MQSVHWLRSSAVYGPVIGLPVVPEEAWTRTRSCLGTAHNPNG